MALVVLSKAVPIKVLYKRFLILIADLKYTSIAIESFNFFSFCCVLFFNASFMSRCHQQNTQKKTKCHFVYTSFGRLLVNLNSFDCFYLTFRSPPKYLMLHIAVYFIVTHSARITTQIFMVKLRKRRKNEQQQQQKHWKRQNANRTLPKCQRSSTQIFNLFSAKRFKNKENSIRCWKIYRTKFVILYAVCSQFNLQFEMMKVFFCVRFVFAGRWKCVFYGDFVFLVLWNCISTCWIH